MSQSDRDADGDDRGRVRGRAVERGDRVRSELPDWWPYLCLAVAAVVFGYVLVQFVRAG